MSIIGKKFNSNEDSNIKINWDTASPFPIPPSSSTSHPASFHTNSNIKRTSLAPPPPPPIISSTTSASNRTLTPPPHKVIKRDKPTPENNNSSVRLHHKPGSTIPNLRLGSERTNRAAKWLIEENLKVITSTLSRSPLIFCF